MTVTRALLQRLYVRDRLSTRGTGAVLGVGHRDIVRWLHRFGIPVRKRNERSATVPQRFRAKYTILGSGCWQWIAGLNTDGYGSFNPPSGIITAHRWSYQHIGGRKIPSGMTIDHLCRNRACVNPKHMEVVTHKENVLRGVGPTAVNARKTHCVNGHPFVRENLINTPGQRKCKTCHRRIALAYWRNRRG